MAKIGINPLTWTNDDMPELGAATSLETCLTEAKQAGYDGMELGNKFPRDPAVLKPILSKHGLGLASGWYSAKLLERTPTEEIGAVQDHLKLLKAFNAPAMVFAEVTGCVHGDRNRPVTQRPKLSENQWKTLTSRMTEVGKYLADQGCPIAYHHHMGTVIETEAEIDRLMAETGKEVGLLLDTGHLTYAGGDAVAVAKRHGARINHVHCKDIRPQVLARSKANDASFLDSVLAGVFTVPGDGSIDYPAVLSALKPFGYPGWFVVEAEQDPAKAHPLTYAKKGHDYLRPLVKALGF
jgi:inosose dehydratase